MGEGERGFRPEDRYLYLLGEMTDEQCKEVAAGVVRHWDRELVLFINSDGGSSFNALGLVNLIKAHGRVDTVCLGVALSGAADCLAAGRRRSIAPNAIVMIHQVSWDLGNEITANLLKNARFLERLNSQFTELLARDTGHSVERLTADMVTDHYLFGQEIIDYGLADGYFDPAQMMAGARRSLRPGRRAAEPDETPVRKPHGEKEP